MHDVETEVIAHLVDEVILGGHISSRLPTDFASLLPYVTLRRAPGSRYIDANTKRLEAVRLQANSYGEIGDDAAAFGAIKTVIEAIETLEGTTVGALFITGVEVPQTPDWAPDPNSDPERPGYRSFLTIYAHA